MLELLAHHVQQPSLSALRASTRRAGQSHHRLPAGVASLCFAALCASCANGQPICTDILLRRGAKITVKNLQETPPLHLAVSNGNWQVTELLIKSEDGCNSIDHVDGKGCTALMMAAKEGNSGLIELIINFRSSASSRQNVLEATDKQGNYIMATILEG